jgi:hypothetical protein
MTVAAQIPLTQIIGDEQNDIHPAWRRVGNARVDEAQ